MILTKHELTKIQGGGWKAFLGIFAGALTLISGIVDGLFRPLACH